MDNPHRAPRFGRLRRALAPALMAACCVALVIVASAPVGAAAASRLSCAQALSSCPGNGTSCPIDVSISPRDTLMEIDIFGHPVTSCGAAIHVLREAAKRLPQGPSWGAVSGWRCRWGLDSATCVRRKAIVWAANPGD